MDVGRSALNLVGGISDRFMTRIPSFMLQANDVPRDEYLSRLRFYIERLEQTQRDEAGGDPFFPLPATAPAHELLETLPRPGGARLLYRYPSRFEGLDRSMAGALASHRANQHGYLHVWRHDSQHDGGNRPGRSRPLVLCVHGFGMSGPARGERMFKIERLYERGLDVALHHLPHHWRRSDRPPNNEFLRPQDLPLTIEEWARNLHDLHSAVLLLRQAGHARIGMIGASLGGLTGGLYATAQVSEQLDFIFLVVPAVDLSNYLKPRAGLMRFAPDAELHALTRLAVRCIVPHQHRLAFDPDRIGVVAHQGDRICPIGPTRELVQRWGLKHYTEVVGGHWIYLDHKVRGRTWYGWLERMGYLPGR